MGLGRQQQEAYGLIKDFFNSKKTVFSLVGYAGTGKSFMINEIKKLAYKKFRQVVLCAPTHKAASVLARFTGGETKTLHSLLSLFPNLEIFDLDFRDLMFYSSGALPNFPANGLVICDESSMINDEIFRFLEDACQRMGSKILFVGDKAQLMPVCSKEYSRVFDCPDRYELTEIFRQSSESGLATILPILREEPIEFFDEAIGTKGSLKVYDRAVDLFTTALPEFKKAIKENNIFHTKMLAFTNKRTELLNKKVRSVLFKEDQFYKGELLTAYENFTFAGEGFHNSEDFSIAEKPTKTQLNIPGFIKLPAWKLELFDGQDIRDVCVLDNEIDDTYMESLAHFVEELRLKAVEAKKNHWRGSGELWKKYYRLMESFATSKEMYYDDRLIRKKSFDYGYAMTVHKS